MKIPLSKFKAILLYFCNNTNSKFLGKVKLMKLFYFLDFISVKKYGLPITFDTYYKLEHGPIPTVIKNMIDEASEDIEESELSDIIYFKTPNGTTMRRCLPIKKFTKENEKLFSESELNILKEVCLRFGNLTTRQIEEISHKEAPWKESLFLQQIPYTLASHDADCNFKEEEIQFLIGVYK